MTGPTRWRTVALTLGLIASAATLAIGSPALGQGACCFFGDSCAPVADEAECATMGGIFLPGEDCTNNPCDTGACCFDLSCSQASAFDCIIAGRTFAGAGVTCLADPCESNVGACCFADGTCMDLSPEDCAAATGTWLGAGTNCAQELCVLGACCLPGACMEITQGECTAVGGIFFPGDVCMGDPCIAEGCPNDTHFGQSADTPDDFVAGSSEQSADFIRFENFSNVPGPIASLRFWGLDLDHIGNNNFIECVENDPTFEISFHQDAGGQPGALVCTETLLVSRTPTGIFYLGAELNEYEVTLTTPCVLVNGWVSIVGLGDPECWFLWMSAGFGVSWCEGCLPSNQTFDLALCLVGPTGGVIGACCDEVAGTCVEAVDIAECAAPGLRFEPGLSCSQIDPACGVILGACCFEDATCRLLELPDCTAQGGQWLGANTLCDQCPCLTPCPAGGAPEGETTCFGGYSDDFNAGCNAPGPPVFQPITPGTTVCAEGGVYLSGPDNVPDFDYYQFTLNETTDVSWSVEAQFPAQIWIVDGTAGCPGVVVDSTLGFECDDLEIATTLGAGTYWAVVAAWAFTDTAFCGAEYVARLATPTCLGDLDGDGVVGIGDLLTLLAGWGNPGPADLDGSGTVAIGDLLILLAAWGSCP